MMLLVGDMHVKKSNLEESQRLLEWILVEAKEIEKKIGHVDVVFLGDQLNDFGVARVEAIQLWSNFVDNVVGNYWYENIDLIFLVGNHDYNSDCSATAITSLRRGNRSIVVDGITPIITDNRKHLFVSYYKDNDQFIEDIAKHTDTDRLTNIFCHQSFNGAKFENGFYDPHGVDIEKFQSEVIKGKDIQVISGHIHEEQDVAGFIWYPGTPRQLTRSDSGSAKGIWKFDPNTRVKEFIPTPVAVSEPFIEIKIDEGSGMPDLSDISAASRAYIDVRGSELFVKSVLEHEGFPKHAKVRTFVDSSNVKIEIKESEGIPSAFRKFTDGYFQENNVSDVDSEAIMKKVFDVCPRLKENR